ncbi:MAG: serine/threonine protein kinase [Deltaproteobacteria bacterium]|nr:MAG: serine/threonine protein kinase [Deltaproteobacteria bacterium]
MKEPRSGAWATTSADPDARGERYERGERLGTGGMGAVWRARDTQLQRDVAFKTVALGADEETRTRLIQEARLAGHLTDRGVVQVHDQGTLPDGRPFYVMELLEFPLLGRGKDADLRALIEVSRTVGEAHRAGLVHRDLKPSNLGLRGNQPVVADWGLARPFGEDARWKESVLHTHHAKTRTGVAMGTAGYLAPEQMTGSAADPRADVWSLGAMLYEVLTGRPPYDDEGAHRLLNEVVSGAQILDDTPLGGVVRKALAIDPGERPANGLALAEALEAALAPVVPAPRGVRWRSFAVGAALIGASLGWWARPGSPDHTALASGALADQAWMLYRRGLTLRAHTIGEQAHALLPTPLTNGLRAAELSVERTAMPTPEDCEVLELDPDGDSRLCVRGEQVTLYASDGRVRWERRTPGLTGAELRDGTVRVRARMVWEEIDRNGNTTLHLEQNNVEELAMLGDQVFRREDRRLAGRDDGPAIVGFGPETEQGLILLTPDDRMFAARPSGEFEDLGAFGEPLVGWRADADEVVLVGLRGLVVRLSPELEERERYQLSGASQVLSAAVGPDGQVAANTEDGVIVYKRSVPTQHVWPTRVASLSLGDDGVPVIYDGTRILRLTSRLPHTVAHIPGSITLIDANSRYLRIGTDRGHAVLDREHLTGAPTPLPVRGPIRQLAENSHEVVWVGPAQSWATVHKMALPFASAAALADQRIILAKRRHDGLAQYLEGELKQLEPAPTSLLWLLPSHDRKQLLAHATDGRLWTARPDGEGLVWTDTGIDGVTRVVDSPHGHLIARGEALSLHEGWSHDLGSPITALTASEKWLVAGTLAGEVWVFTPDGSVAARMPAHLERVSALDLLGDRLYSGSWAPGLRSWNLAAVQPLD